MQHEGCCSREQEGYFTFIFYFLFPLVVSTLQSASKGPV